MDYVFQPEKCGRRTKLSPDNYTIPELKKLAKKRGIKFTSKSTKTYLCKAISDYDGVSANPVAQLEETVFLMNPTLKNPEIGDLTKKVRKIKKQLKGLVEKGIVVREPKLLREIDILFSIEKDKSPTSLRTKIMKHRNGKVAMTNTIPVAKPFYFV